MKAEIKSNHRIVTLLYAMPTEGWMQADDGEIYRLSELRLLTEQELKSLNEAPDYPSLPEETPEQASANAYMLNFLEATAKKERRAWARSARLTIAVELLRIYQVPGTNLKEICALADRYVRELMSYDE